MTAFAKQMGWLKPKQAFNMCSHSQNIPFTAAPIPEKKIKWRSYAKWCMCIMHKDRRPCRSNTPWTLQHTALVKEKWKRTNVVNKIRTNRGVDLATTSQDKTLNKQCESFLTLFYMQILSFILLLNIILICILSLFYLLLWLRGSF